MNEWFARDTSEKVRAIKRAQGMAGKHAAVHPLYGYKKDPDNLEKHHYIEPHHGKRILNGLWEIGQAIKQHQYMEIEYERINSSKCVQRRIQPVGIMFFEYYFYLTAFFADKTNFENPDDLFRRSIVLTAFSLSGCWTNASMCRTNVPYKDRFEEGEFRKRVQFMYGGKLQKIEFRYTGPSIEAVPDRLPTAKIVSTEADEWTIHAEVFGKGIDMWLRSQGDYIKLENVSYEVG